MKNSQNNAWKIPENFFISRNFLRNFLFVQANDNIFIFWNLGFHLKFIFLNPKSKILSVNQFSPFEFDCFHVIYMLMLYWCWCFKMINDKWKGGKWESDILKWNDAWTRSLDVTYISESRDWNTVIMMMTKSWCQI